jgi:AcrR family transcriptional regulator
MRDSAEASFPRARARSIKKAPRIRRNRDREIVKAATLIFAQKGYAGASVQDVADAVGVLKGSLYHYIGSKEDLLFRIFDESHQEAARHMAEVSAMDADALTKLYVYFKRLVQAALLNRERSTLYFRDWRQLKGARLKKVMMQREEYEAFVRTLIVEAYRSAGTEVTINPKYVSFFLLGGLNWVADWYRSSGPDSAEVVAESYARIAVATVTGSQRPPPSLQWGLGSKP